MKMTISDIVEELRDSAESNAAAVDYKVMSVQDTMEWEAADLIEELVGVLKTIADGTPDPAGTAHDAIDPKARMIRSLNQG